MNTMPPRSEPHLYIPLGERYVSPTDKADPLYDSAELSSWGSLTPPTQLNPKGERWWSVLRADGTPTS